MPQKIQRPSARELLKRLIESPSLVAAVQSLEPRHLAKLIDRLGLEDCGEVLSLATTAQLARLFDEDLWKSERPGKDEAFDADRLALWIEVMVEVGEDFAAEKLAALDEDLITLLFHRRFLILDSEELRLALEDGGAGSALVEKALDSSLYEELGGYQVIARQHAGWDAMLSLLLALDKANHALVERMLARCCALSAADVEENGLYQVLTSEEMLEVDVAALREERRAAQGFIAPSAAASFLKLCRMTPPEQVIAEPRDAVTRRYFRDRAPVGAAPRAAGARSAGASQLEALIASLDEAAPRPAGERHRLLVGPSGEADRTAHALLGNALACLAERDAEAAARRVDELGYLANVLAAGCALGGGGFRPFEAALAAAATCNLGLERLTREADAPLSAVHAADMLAHHGADKAFRVGFWILHREVVVAACHALARALRRRADTAADGELRRRLDRAASALGAAAAGEKPWQTRRQLQELEPMFDAPTQRALLSLLSEYPVFSGRLSQGSSARHRLDGERQLIAAAEDLHRLRAFLDGL